MRIEDTILRNDYSDVKTKIAEGEALKQTFPAVDEKLATAERFHS